MNGETLYADHLTALAEMEADCKRRSENHARDNSLWLAALAELNERFEACFKQKEYSEHHWGLANQAIAERDKRIEALEHENACLRKSEPEYQAQLKWAHEAMSIVQQCPEECRFRERFEQRIAALEAENARLTEALRDIDAEVEDDGSLLKCGMIARDALESSP